eukprot:TRINITY_DN12831_c0_g1_i12.p1 TRINITY_DN12831_c0_g1~~TRINITY_DN12831_c0_g1_i12.p1  ORF type:complete len:419 (-),score=83.14 TRINITY_DN12831_c0_g1_i12:531-1787(-)
MGYLFFFFFKQKTAYEMLRSLVGSEMCIRDRYQRRVRGQTPTIMGWFSTAMKVTVLYVVVKMAMRRSTARQDSSLSNRGSLSPLWSEGELLDLGVFISEQAVLTDWVRAIPVWQQQGLRYHLEDPHKLETHITIPVTDRLASNGSMYAHVFFTRTGLSPDPTSEGYERDSTVFGSVSLVRHYRELLMRPARNLISGEQNMVPDRRESHGSESQAGAKLVAHWTPELDLSLLADWTTYQPGRIPSLLQPRFRFAETGDGTRYLPALYLDALWMTRDQTIPINSSLQTLPLKISYSPIGIIKLQMQLQMEQSWKQREAMGLQGSSETDTLRKIMVETNPYLLGVTAVVSVLHMVFDLLAVKNDISFWRNNKSMEGLSVKKIWTELVVSVIILLYLIDNDTSSPVLLSSGLGVLVQVRLTV